MRRFGSAFILMASMALASANVLPRTLWERKARIEGRKMASSSGSSSTDQLRNLLNINAGTLQAFSSVTGDLVSKANYQGVDSDGFDKMFKTFKILQQAPAYQQAVASGADMSSPQVQADILSKSVSQMANMALNLHSAMDVNKKGNINDKVVEFLNNADQDTLALADAVENGESGSINELQQAFVDKYFPGLNLQALQDDDFVTSSRDLLANDSGMQNLMNNDESTLNVLLDEDLLFANSPLLPQNQA